MRDILFITSNRIGDAVLSTGILKYLVDTYPDAAITIACGPFGADLFRATPRLKDLHIMRKKKYHGHWWDLWCTTRSTKWDIVVDLRDSIVSRLVRAKQVYRPLRITAPLHKVVEHGLIIHQSPPPSPHIYLDNAAYARAATLLPPEGTPLLALGPAANWPPKQWPIERFTELAKRLTAADGPLPHARVMVIADSREDDQVRPLLNAIPSEQVIALMGHDLLTIAACLARAKLFVGNDSGLMHMAAAMGTPTLGLFGPGYEDIYGPWGQNTAFVRTDESRDSLLARMPDLSAREPNLMLSLSVEKAFTAATALFLTHDQR